MSPATTRGAVSRAFRLSTWLGVALVGAKAAHWAWPAYGFREWARDVAVSAHADVAFALGFGLLAAALLAVTAHRPAAQAWAWRVLLALGAACAFYAAASIQIFAFLRSPLTYPLLYLAGDARNMRSSIGSFLTPAVAMGLVLVPLAYLLAVAFSARLGPSLPAATRALQAGVVLAASGWIFFGARTAEGRWKDRADHSIARSPHWELLASFAGVARGAGPPAIAEPVSPDLLEEFRPAPASLVRRRAGAPRNVLVVVLESTAARYMSLYGSRYATTPHLDAEAAHARVFDGFYSHVGLTANAMAAINLSVYPYMTWREYTVEYPDLSGETLAGVLRPRGYRTAFLHSGNLDYVGQDRFLAGRGFDELLGWKDLADSPPLTSWGGTDRVLVDGVLDWIDRDRSRPFYAMAWTVQSHHPYEPVPGAPFVDFFRSGPLPPDDWDLRRYLNTIAEVDRQLGRLFDGLRERGLAEDTLVVVTADHGQAFGDPHPTWGHGFRVYEENVRVPLMIWNPRLFPQGERSPVVGGHVDLNPTVADLLGLPAAPSWQGRSLLDEARAPRTYFYAANDDYLLGVREGRFKYVYNATRGSEELFDLAADPEERTNVARRHPETCRSLRRHVAAWRTHVGRDLEARLARRDTRIASVD